MKPRIPLLAGALLAATLVPFARSAGATTDDFRRLAPGSAPKEWATFGGGTWSVVKNGSASAYSAEGSSQPGAFASTRPVVVPAAAGGFTVSTTFRITRGTAHPAGEYIGLAAFATQPNLSASSYYVADVQRGSGILRIISLGAENPDFSAQKIEDYVGALSENTDYTLTLVAVSADDGGLTLKLTLSGGDINTTVSASDPTPHPGRNFGLRLNNTTNADPLQVAFADFVFAPAAGKPTR